MAIGCKEIGRPLLVLAGERLCQFPPQGGRKKAIPLLGPLALCDPQVTGLQIDIGAAERHACRLAHPRKQQHVVPHPGRELARLPHRVIEGDECRSREECRQARGGGSGADLQHLACMLQHLREVMRVGGRRAQAAGALLGHRLGRNTAGQQAASKKAGRVTSRAKRPEGWTGS